MLTTVEQQNYILHQFLLMSMTLHEIEIIQNLHSIHNYYLSYISATIFCMNLHSTFLLMIIMVA